MLPSQIQIKTMWYLGIKVWPRNDVPAGTDDVLFDFNDVMIGESVELIEIPPDSAKDNIYGLKLCIRIDNKEGKLAPYDIDVEAAGIFEISSNVKKEEREDFLTVNGCAVLYSAIRDQVLTLTARSANGQLMLPTVHFLDHHKEVVNGKK